MYCKLCGKHLYKKITFRNIFKLDYEVHEECENKMKRNNDYNTFPFLDKLLQIDYLFEERFDDSDEEFLYNKYSIYLFERMLENKEWSIVIITDWELSHETLILVTKLAERVVLVLNVFNENFMKSSENNV